MQSIHDSFAWIFSLVCGQGRCFVVDGQPLPLCQRCLGLYLGAALTLAWLAASGVWRRGLPSRAAFAAQVAALLLALLGGVHAVDWGPRWRLACGLWTGQAVAYWLAAGNICLWRKAGGFTGEVRPGRFQQIQSILAPAVLGLLALFWPGLSDAGWWPISLAACLGISMLTMLLTVSPGCVVYRAIKKRQFRRQPVA